MNNMIFSNKKVYLIDVDNLKWDYTIFDLTSFVSLNFDSLNPYFIKKFIKLYYGMNNKNINEKKYLEVASYIILIYKFRYARWSKSFSKFFKENLSEF